tara:strand:+ start:30029 stop:30310 length:282 start_codon:yes stop_codon:yes gene_type:complete
MTRLCKVTGKRPVSGNNVSHANNKTKRRFLPNLHNVTFGSELLKRKISLRVSTAGLRTVEHNGGIDNYLKTTSNSKLTPEMLKLKKQIEKNAS